MRISDWSSDVCSSDLSPPQNGQIARGYQCGFAHAVQRRIRKRPSRAAAANLAVSGVAGGAGSIIRAPGSASPSRGGSPRSEEHTSELQSLMRISYAVFCLKKKNT